MSKIGKIPVPLKEGITVTEQAGIATVTGSKATLSYALPAGISVEVKDNMLIVSQKNTDSKDASALYGLARATLANMVKGVEEGFEKKLELSGVGYRANVSGTDLMLSVGFSHQVRVPAPQGIKFTVVENVITITGHDKVLVGDTASKIRAIRKPEPYKGKGIKYVGEWIRRKAGKAAKAVGAK